MKRKQVVGIVIASVLFLFVAISGVMVANSVRNNMTNFFKGDPNIGMPEPSNNVAIVNITGTIDATSYDALGKPTSSYYHDGIMSLIEDMTYSYSNTGLFLLIDSGGGSVYESDEVYRALMDYKEITGRPIFAYASHTMASGAYYIACAADKIYANRNATVGSIGVYIQAVNFSGLYEKLGIEGEFIKSGQNKAMGNQFDSLNDEQRSIYQSIVDEYYYTFLDIVCESRGYTREEALPICDGRIYSSAQGLEIGIIDNATSSYKKALDDLMTACGAYEVYDRVYPTSGLGSFFGSIFELATTTETERLLALVENSESGVPMYYAG